MKLVPDFVEFDFQGLELFVQSLYEITGKKPEVVRGVTELAAEKKWHGVILIGAPTEVMNPGLFADLKAAVQIPVTTALTASVHALQHYGAKRLLLLTPFETRLNGMIEEYLTEGGFSCARPSPLPTSARPAVWAGSGLRSHPTGVGRSRLRRCHILSRRCARSIAGVATDRRRSKDYRRR